MTLDEKLRRRQHFLQLGNIICHDNPSSSCGDISLKATNVSLVFALEENSGGDQSH